MKNYRLYGKEPYRVILLHGGPGAWGEMTEVALELEKEYGIIETYQTKPTIQGQIEELYQIIHEKGNEPITIIGFSWGAWLGY